MSYYERYKAQSFASLSSELVIEKAEAKLQEWESKRTKLKQEKEAIIQNRKNRQANAFWLIRWIYDPSLTMSDEIKYSIPIFQYDDQIERARNLIRLATWSSTVNITARDAGFLNIEYDV